MGGKVVDFKDKKNQQKRVLQQQKAIQDKRNRYQ